LAAADGFVKEFNTDDAGTFFASYAASYAFDSIGALVSVRMGQDPANAPRYWYVYTAYGDLVSLVDANGVSVASYSYDSWGNLTASSESFTNGWTNPYRYDGRDGARYDASDGLYWLSVRAYDPSIGRFLSRAPLGRAPLFLSDNPYVYAGNNPAQQHGPQRAVSGGGTGRDDAGS
jgi:RHS repeat-associated protein